ncbi:TetR/AcrR family transcriptional regulator [Terriglobus aquaticus]|uniref:TetR/AcrR family transcriptional regulator n=1 Tax=Terriglobus aquaticus TaxID=940139 RepID=A0ABW9KFI0_9BACT|nr:WHG domain-containing protein [Terriglobus aquaticus]
MPAVAKTDRDTILQAALLRLRRDGLAGLSLRALAADVGIATNALYHYFPSRSHLENALSEEAARRLLAALQRGTATRRIDESREGSKAAAAERIRALAAGYLRFARREPHLYAAMLQGPCEPGESNANHAALWNFVCETAGVLHGDKRADSAAMSLWALLHGAVALQQAGALAGVKAGDCVRFGLDAWIASP